MFGELFVVECGALEHCGEMLAGRIDEANHQSVRERATRRLFYRGVAITQRECAKFRIVRRHAEDFCFCFLLSLFCPVVHTFLVHPLEYWINGMSRGVS